MKKRLKKSLTTSNTRKKRLEKEVYAIKQGDNFEREKAIEYLISRPTKKTVERVLPLLSDKNTFIRMAALEIIKKTGHANIDAIIELLENDNEDIRLYACEIMMSLKSTEVISHLIKVLDRDSENVKNAAVVALGEFNDDRAVKALLGMLKEDQWIVFSAICSLGKTRHHTAVEPLFEVYQNGEEEISLAACEVLMAYEDNEILDRIFTILKGWNKKKRVRYVEVVIQQGNENLFLRLKKNMGYDLFEHLVAYITNGNQRVIHVLKLITHFMSPQACDVLLEILKGMDADGAEYDEVLQLFVSLSQVWKTNLREYLSRGDEYVLAITRACGHTKIRIEEDVLLKLFNASSAIVKRGIIKNIDKIITGNGYELLREALRDQDGHVKSYAVHAAAVLGLTLLKDDIIALVKEGFMDVRINALQSLVELDNVEAMRLLNQFVFAGSNDDKKVYLAVAGNITGDENYPLIQKLFTNSDQDIKKTAVTVIGNYIDDAKYVEFFQKLLVEKNIPHEVLKIIKEKRLTQFGPQLKEIFADTSKGLWTRYYALLALGAFEDSSFFELFARGLNDENNLIKIGSLKALKDLSDARAIDYVKPFINSNNEDVRSTAEFVMSSLGEHHIE